MMDYLRVLLVEDNPGDTVLIKEILKGNAKISVAGRLSTALSKIKRQNYDIILLDLNLPDSTGLDTFRKLNKTAVLTPVIIISVLDDERLIIDAIRAGAQDYLIKDSTSLGALPNIIRQSIERKKVQNDLRDSAEKLHLMINEVKDYAIYMLSPEGIIMNWNEGARLIKGYTPKDIIGRHFSGLYTEEDRKAKKPEKALKTAAKKGRYEEEGWQLRKDGTRFLASTVITPIKDKQGRLIGFTKITRDITNHLEAEEALKRLGRLNDFKKELEKRKS